MQSDTDHIPAEVKLFLYEYVLSVGHLEFLLFLYEGKDRSWSIEELTKHLRTNLSLAQQHLSNLSRLVVCEQGANPVMCRLNPEDSYTLEIVAKISELYKTRQHAVIRTIYTRPLDSIRSFADAFKIKKDDK